MVIETYLRIASLSIALYDYILTLPAEWRFYRSQISILRLTAACILFILIRYTSILVLLISNYGFFATSFSQEKCRKFFMAAPTCKVIQTMVSHTILGIRTFNITRRASRVKWFMIFFFLVTIFLEGFTDMYHRIPVSINGNCVPVNSGAHLSSWLYYLVAMVYDIVSLAISTIFLFKLHTRDSRMSRLLRIMLFDGLGYFVVLTASNVFNLLTFRTSNEALQSSGASLGYAVTWICSQRLLIHLREIVSEHESKQLDSVVLGHQLQNSRNSKNRKAVRSPFDKKSTTLERSYEVDSNKDVELDVQVHVEHSVVVDYPSHDYGEESYQEPSHVVWDPQKSP